MVLFFFCFVFTTISTYQQPAATGTEEGDEPQKQKRCRGRGERRQVTRRGNREVKKREERRLEEEINLVSGAHGRPIEEKA